MKCQVTYEDWAAETFGVDCAAAIMVSANGPMHCTLPDGHPDEHKWAPNDKPDRPFWTSPQEFNRWKTRD